VLSWISCSLFVALLCLPFSEVFSIMGNLIIALNTTSCLQGRALSLVRVMNDCELALECFSGSVWTRFPLPV
jgi:hypothetical protein